MKQTENGSLCEHMPLYGAITYKPSINKPLCQSFSLVLYRLFFYTEFRRVPYGYGTGQNDEVLSPFMKRGRPVTGRFNYLLVPMRQIQITSSGGSTASSSSLWHRHRSLHQTVQLPPDPHYDTDTDHFIRRFNHLLILFMTQITSSDGSTTSWSSLWHRSLPSDGSTASWSSLWHRYRSLH